MIAENLTRSTVAPTIKQAEIAQKAPWKITHVYSANVPDNELKSIPAKNMVPKPPKKSPKTPSTGPKAKL